ncbi:Set1/Ash2 histone methyltransferase complex subunit ASH2 [Pancytospora philotis]|nr:Set1/Ash2 histone methyltransferase complex subunit ASH2 [Pancytospora philotis]
MTLEFDNARKHDSVTISSDRLSLTGSQGYRSAVAGKAKKGQVALPLYFEATIENDEGYARVGVATTDCELGGPVGIDAEGYSYGNKNGYGFHRGKRVRMGERFFVHNILSVYLYEEGGSLRLRFFINGSEAERGFCNLRPGDYRPAVSLYNGCRVSLYFGDTPAYYDTIMNKLQAGVSAVSFVEMG